MTDTLAILGLIGAVCAVGYVAWRWGGREALAAAGGLSALALTAWAMLRTLRPLPPRAAPPRQPDAPLPEEAKERIAVAEHDATRADLARAKAEGPKAYRDRLTDEVAKRWRK